MYDHPINTATSTATKEERKTKPHAVDDTIAEDTAAVVVKIPILIIVTINQGSGGITATPFHVRTLALCARPIVLATVSSAEIAMMDAMVVVAVSMVVNPSLSWWCCCYG